MAGVSGRGLPRGRHALPRAEVERAQRGRLMAAMAAAMSEKGYAATSVADVLRRSGVSRQSFYQLFSSKLDCFMAAFDVAAELLLRRLAAARDDGLDPIERFDRALGAYLETLAGEPAYARLFLVEVHAAGPEAIVRRAAVQGELADRLAELIGAERFACRMVVAATGALVTPLLVADDIDGLRALRAPIVEHVRGLLK